MAEPGESNSITGESLLADLNELDEVFVSGDGDLTRYWDHADNPSGNTAVSELYTKLGISEEDFVESSSDVLEDGVEIKLLDAPVPGRPELTVREARAKKGSRLFVEIRLLKSLETANG